MERVDVTFPSGSQQCAAWLYRPDGVPKPSPLVVMGHGLGANREMGLDQYAALCRDRVVLSLDEYTATVLRGMA